MRSIKLAATLGALALGTALSALPALAQDYRMGRSLNDNGSFTNDNGGVKTGQIAPRAPKGAHMTQNRSSGEGRGLYNSTGPETASPQQYKYSAGRGMNDGGISTSQYDKGAQRTGSNSNREAFRSGGENYAPGGQGQMPQTAPNAYGYTR